jgi:uncharacterized membrane protein
MTRSIRVPLAWISALTLAAGVSCSEMNVTAVDVAFVQVLPDTASVVVGASRQLEVRLEDAAGNALTGRPVTWSSSDPGVVGVEGDGRITGVTAGSATVTASSGTASADARVTVLAAGELFADPPRAVLSSVQSGGPVTVGVGIGNAGTGSVNGLQATIAYANGQPTGWLQATLLGTSTPTALHLTATPGSLPAAVYQATVTISSATPGAASTPVPVEFTVTAFMPSIALGESAVQFQAAQGAGDPAPSTVSVTNAGGGVLTGLGASITYEAGQPGGWLAASLSPATAPSTLTLSASAGALPAGTYNATVHIVSPVADNSPRALPVTLTVGAPPPAIALSETSRLFTATAGGADPGPHQITITNAGGGTLGGLSARVVYPSGQAADWLVPILSGPVAPATLSIGPRIGSLAPGTYTATVEVISTSATNSPQPISVTLQVGAPATPPTIVLAPDTATFAATAGAANPAARTIQVANGGGGTLDNLTATVSYGTGQAGWLAATLGASAAPTTLVLQPDITGLAAGTYTATVAVASTAASNSPGTVSVTLNVAAQQVPPAIALSRNTVGFAAIAAAGNPASQTVDISNSGGGTLSGLATQIRYTSGQPSGWLAASLGATTAPSTLTLNATTGLLLPGTYTAVVDVQAPGTSNSPQSIAVTFQVTAPVLPPSIGLNPSSVTFNATAGGSNPASQAIAVANSGGGTLTDLSTSVTYGSGQPTGWLAATLGATSAPTNITVAATTGSLPAGTYTATVEVRSSVASNSPQTVAVTFQVAAAPVPPAISLSRTSVSFAATAGGGNPSAQTVDIGNSGGGSLDDLTTSISYASGQPTGWLTATLASNTAPTQLTLQAVTGSLAAGTYSATVDVRSAKSSNSPRAITVTFQVAPSALAPAAPTNLRARARGDDEIMLNWDDNANNETQYVVQRSALGPGLWTFSVTLPANTNNYRDEDLRADTRYWYRVLACNAAGCTASGIVDERTDDD